MKGDCLVKWLGLLSAAVALGMLIQIFLPDILIIAICCVLVIVMGVAIGKLM